MIVMRRVGFCAWRVVAVLRPRTPAPMTSTGSEHDELEGMFEVLCFIFA